MARNGALPGWAEDIMAARQPDDLPDAARGYVAFVAAGAPVSHLPVGPGREQFIVME